MSWGASVVDWSDRNEYRRIEAISYERPRPKLDLFVETTAIKPVTARLFANNILSPASGRPIVTPSQDLIIGGYYLTEELDAVGTAPRVFRHLWEVLRALDEGALNIHEKITMRRPMPDGTIDVFDSTPGRLLFEEALPADYPKRFGHINELVKKKEMGVIVERLSDNYKKSEVAAALDAIKNVCYRWAAQSGLTVSIDDVKTPKSK
eukprot:gene35012-57892_t